MTFHATNAITKEVGGPQYWTQIIDLKKIQYKQERALEKMALFIGAYKSDRISNLFQIYLGLNVLMVQRDLLQLFIVLLVVFACAKIETFPVITTAYK